MGLSNDKVTSCLVIKESNLYNEVSDLYGKLGISKCLTELIMAGLLNGFNHYGFVNGINVLDADERRRLQKLNPRLLREPISLQVTLTAA